MPKYHYNEESGKLGLCKAVYKCPLGDNTPHFNNKIDAAKYVEEFENDRAKLAQLHKEFYQLKTKNFGTDSRLVADRKSVV